MIEQLLQADRLLTVDMVDQADAIYTGVAAADPLNAMAMVGRARCALARGDDRGAWELAVRALEIDPEDDMARRMEARLAEVLAYRGEPVQRPAAAADAASHPMRASVTGDAESAAPDARAPAGSAPDKGAQVAGAQVATTSAPGARRSLIDRLRGR